MAAQASMREQQQTVLRRLAANLLAEVMNQLGETSWRDAHPEAYEDLIEHLPFLQRAMLEAMVAQLGRATGRGGLDEGQVDD